VVCFTPPTPPALPLVHAFLCGGGETFAQPMSHDAACGPLDQQVSHGTHVGGGEQFFWPNISTQTDSLCCQKMLLNVAFQLCHQDIWVFVCQCSARHIVPMIQGSNQCPQLIILDDLNWYIFTPNKYWVSLYWTDDVHCPCCMLFFLLVFAGV